MIPTTAQSAIKLFSICKVWESGQGYCKRLASECNLVLRGSSRSVPFDACMASALPSESEQERSGTLQVHQAASLQAVDSLHAVLGQDAGLQLKHIVLEEVLVDLRIQIRLITHQLEKTKTRLKTAEDTSTKC